jgi:hypothetical protein
VPANAPAGIIPAEAVAPRTAEAVSPGAIPAAPRDEAIAAGVPIIYPPPRDAGIGIAISVAPIAGVAVIAIPGCKARADSCEGVMFTTEPSGMVITATASSTALDKETIKGLNRKAEIISNVSTFFIKDSF